MEIIIPISYIKCALVTAAAKDVRYYLNGLAILPHKTGAILATADGHRLTMLHIPGPFGLPEGGAILPRDFCERVAKFKYAAKNPQETFTIEGSRVRATLAGMDAALVDGRFPDVARVVPKECSGEVSQFDPRYLGDLAKQAIALGAGATNVYIHHNGETSAARITMGGHPEFLGVLMPVRVEDAPAAGDWAKEL